jgi:hypothetical protein
LPVYKTDCTSGLDQPPSPEVYTLCDLRTDGGALALSRLIVPAWKATRVDPVIALREE